MVFISQGRGRGTRGRGRGGVGEVAFQSKPAHHRPHPGHNLDDHKTKVALARVRDFPTLSKQGPGTNDFGKNNTYISQIGKMDAKQNR